jgi:hypothetical protein
LLFLSYKNDQVERGKTGSRDGGGGGKQNVENGGSEGERRSRK